MYDSTDDTKEHIGKVRELIVWVTKLLNARASFHDASKLHPPEKTIFDEFTPKLKNSTYGSDEYKEFLEGMGEALQHHYRSNKHHPEHWANGVDGMSLIDLLEMLCDWKAATERHADGSMSKSLELNKERFKIGDQLQSVLKNTASYLWGTK